MSEAREIQPKSGANCDVVAAYTYTVKIPAGTYERAAALSFAGRTESP